MNIERANMKKFEIEVEKVTGYCSCGYSPGDKFYAEGLKTPSKEICGGAYMILFPLQTALHSMLRAYALGEKGANQLSDLRHLPH
jgi:uncharacterized repeat protein (TIGR04076 family)